jgi:DNA-binding GntR family transcriptional regulator
MPKTAGVVRTGGVGLNGRPTAGSAAADRRGAGAVTARLYRRLLADILHGRQEPGARVRVLPLAHSYGTSSATMREVLIQLTGAGLVVRHPVHGFQIAPATPDELLDLVRTLGWLEGIGLRESIAAGDRLWEEGVLAASRGLSQCARPSRPPTDKELSTWEEHVLSYHDALIAACRSTILIEQCGALQRRVLRYRNLAAGASGDDNVLDYCLRIRNAALDRDADAAAQLLQAYYRLTTDIVLASGTLN